MRITHIPTGLTATAQEERSQHRNKRLALARLVSVFKEKNQEKKSAKAKEKWIKHYQLKRGDPVRIFVGAEFKEKT